MVPLPVIVGFGGINAAGRSSFHHAYRRLVIDSLPKERARQAWSALAATMNISCDASGPNDEQIASMRAHTLIRRIEGEYFDVDRTHVHLRARIKNDDTPLSLAKNQPLLSDVPAAWKTSNADNKGDMELRVAAGEEVMLPHYTPLPARGAGQLPSGCVLGGYGSKHHPRGLEMSVYALSDALNSLGLDWDTLRKRVPPEQISVYSASAMGQLDKNGTGGLLRAHLLGERTSARNCPLGLVEMPADFSNAYVLGNMGNTGGVVGACATLLYNLRAAVHDIRSGDAQIAVVGASEAPIVPEVLASYIAMGAWQPMRVCANWTALTVNRIGAPRADLLLRTVVLPLPSPRSTSSCSVMRWHWKPVRTYTVAWPMCIRMLTVTRSPSPPQV